MVKPRIIRIALHLAVFGFLILPIFQPAGAMNEVVDIIHVRDLWTAEWVAPNGTIMKGVTGKGVGVAIIDTGIDGTHPDFAGRIVYNAKYSPEAGWVELPNTDLDVGHGTFCAGIFGGDGTNSDGLYKGIAPECNLIGLAADVAILIPFAQFAHKWIYENAEKYNIKVVSNSYGEGTVSTLSSELKSVVDKNILYVYCTGNGNGDGSNDNTVNYKHPMGVINVGASLKDGNMWDGSSGGYKNDTSSWVVVVSPQDRIISTISKTGAYVNANIVSNPEENLQLMLKGYMRAPTGGTSASTPQVAGVAALVFQVNPNLTPAQVKKIIELSADPNFGPYNETGWKSGYGLVNATRAVAVAHYMVLRPDATIAEALKYYRIGWKDEHMVLNPLPLPEVSKNEKEKFDDGLEEEIREFPDAITYGNESNVLRFYLKENCTLSKEAPENNEDKLVKLAMNQYTTFGIKFDENFTLRKGARTAYFRFWTTTDTVSTPYGKYTSGEFTFTLLKNGENVGWGQTAFGLESYFKSNEIYPMDAYIRIYDNMNTTKNDVLELRIFTYSTSTNNTIGNLYLVVDSVDHPSGINLITPPKEIKTQKPDATIAPVQKHGFIPGFESAFVALSICSLALLRRKARK